MKKIILSLFMVGISFLFAGNYPDDQSGVSARTGTKVERFRFENFPELEVVRHTMREIPGVHYFVTDYIKKGGVKYYRMYSCACCLAQEQVIRSRNGEVLSASDLMLIHKIGNPTGQMLRDPWEQDIAPLAGKSSDYTGGPRELLLASL
jgi:hypothetical protein